MECLHGEALDDVADNMITKKGGEKFLEELLEKTNAMVSQEGGIKPHALLWSKASFPDAPFCKKDGVFFSYIEPSKEEFDNRDIMVDQLRQLAFSLGGFCIAFISEAWFVQLERVERVEDFPKDISGDPRRKECVLVHFEHVQVGRRFLTAYIERKDGKAILTEFTAVPTEQLEGRLTSFLPIHTTN